MTYRSFDLGNLAASRFISAESPTNSRAVGGGTRPDGERAMGSDRETRIHAAATTVSLVGLVITAGFYRTAIPIMVASGAVAAMAVLPWALRAGFRYGARRGVEAAIENMALADYRRKADSSGEPSSDR